MASTSPVFQAGGLASGIDSQSMIDSLVAIEKQPMNLLARQQSAIKAQISVIGDISSKLADLESATRTLADDGAMGMVVSSTNTGFDAVAGTGALAGSYGVEVTNLAKAAKARSAGFAASTDAVDTGTLTLSIDGTDYAITKAAGDTVRDIAAKINASGAGVSASIITDGAQSYLSLTRTETGYEVGATADTALTITETNDGTGAPALGLAVFQQAENATFSVDGLAMERRSNEIADAVPGVTLTLNEEGGAAEDLVVGKDLEKTKENLQSYVDAYNAVAKLLQKQLDVGEDTDRSRLLTGEAAVRSLQRRLQDLATTEVPDLGTVRSLVDLGIETGRDGTISLNEETLDRAIASDPTAVNGLFAQAGTGLADSIQTLVEDYTDPLDGILVGRKKSLDGSVDRIDDQLATMQRRLDTFRQNLVSQFTAMEQLVSGMSSMGNFLAAQMTASA